MRSLIRFALLATGLACLLGTTAAIAASPRSTPSANGSSGLLVKCQNPAQCSIQNS